MSRENICHPLPELSLEPKNLTTSLGRSDRWASQVSATILVFKSETAGRQLCGLSLGGTQALRLKEHDAYKNENPQD